MMNPSLSIIIPCYNSGNTLEETLNSVMEQNYEDWEAIIVNDGSTDNTENIAKKFCDKDSRFRYYSKINEGLAKTRNYGIERSKGKFILPLDSDNLLFKDFSFQAMKLFQEEPRLDVVHGDAQYFGDKTGRWRVGEFDLEKILFKNYIDACAIFRKYLWLQVGGYDCDMPFQGNEDWDFWIRLGKIDANFYYLPAMTFKYRVSGDSMIKSFTAEMFEANRSYIASKHSRLIYRYFKKNYLVMQDLKRNPIKGTLLYLKSNVQKLYRKK